MQLHTHKYVWLRILTNPWAAMTVVLLCLSSYLILTNLDYSLLWEDEVNTAVIANNLLQTGTLTTWDGRNLISDENGMNLNSKGHEVLPPLQYLFSALGIAIFGFNELGARSVHTFIGMLALIMLLLLLRQHFPNKPRLIFFIFLFVSLSPQLLLYFRSARYFSFAVFSFITCLYFYEQYWRNGRFLSFIGLTVSGLLAFLNHYTMGAATVATIAIYHLASRASATSRKQWLCFASSATFIAVIGGTYLYSAGVLPIDHNMHNFYGITKMGVTDHTSKLWKGTRIAFASEWLSWVVCLWFLALLNRNNKKHIKRWNEEDSFTQSSRLIVMGALFLLLSIIISPHKASYPRLSVAALPLLLVMKGILISWLSYRSKFLAGLVLVVLLFTSVGAAPFNLLNHATGQPTHGFWLLSFIKEIHRPYRPDPIQEVATYLRKHANKDDLVYVPLRYGHRQNLIPYIGDHILICCQIDTANHRLASKIAKIRRSLFFDPKIIPDWIVIFSPKEDDTWNNYAKSQHHRNWTMVHFPILAAQTQRPELNMHAFEPYPDPVDGGIVILKRKENAGKTWF